VSFGVLRHLLRIDSARNLFPCYMEFGADAVQNNTEARRLHGGQI
jgi:hypothetical protein